MPPERVDEKPRLLQEHRHEYLSPAAPEEKVTTLSVGPNPQPMPPKHDLPANIHLEDPVKRIKLSGDSEMPTRKKHMIPKNEYDGLVENHGQLRELVKEEDQSIDEEYEKHNHTFAEVSEVKTELSDTRQDVSTKTNGLEGTDDDLHRVVSEQATDRQTKDENMEAPRQKIETREIQIDELKNEVEALNQWKREILEHLRTKNQIIADNQREIGDLKRDSDVANTQLQAIKRERDASKVHIHDYRNELATTQEKLGTRDKELDDYRADLEEAREDIDALRTVNNK